MTMRMLIDARHREETRVAVVKGNNRIEEFDFESAEHKQLKGNIYLAKVTRVEPSLQAAFVEYGGNRHGFLAFAEIHPDYYQIPREDREALLAEEAEHAAEEERLRAQEDDDFGDDETAGDADDGHHEDDGSDDRPDADIEGDDDAAPPLAAKADASAADAVRAKRMNLRRRYKIQDVIRRRQVLLIQVVKEERGNKGAALTTYLSLAGRYCVLMPNTSHGGGISRKISNVGDRKRLKTIMADLDLPKTMGCIVRTAGLQRTKVEIKRDFDYLARLWDEIREKTLASAAPALVYQDSDLIKRAIRDIYNKDIEEVIIEGDEGYQQAKQFMKLLMPSHARRVKPYADPVPLFQRHHVEDQLAAMYQPVVQLKSGGYLVINPTEALVSIDINSGRSTREHGIEATAVGTNLEAAHEIARQLRLRDMAGLVVIDFIDMESNGNVRKVEKAMKAALADDRARIQVGRISSFGLMEMSRQRLRTGVLEASTRACPHCEGTGLVRTASSAGLSALRMLEEEAGRGRGSLLTLRCSQEAAFYVLNRKRNELAEIEERFGVRIEVISDGEVEGARMTVEASGPPPAFTPKYEAPVYEDEPDDEVFAEDEDEEEEEERPQRQARGEPRERDAEGEGGARKRGRRRRGRRGPRDGEDGAPVREAGEGEAAEAAEDDDETPREANVAVDGEAARDSEERRGRRGRRGGRRRRGRGTGEGGEGAPQVAPVAAEEADAPASVEAVVEDVTPETKPKTRKRPSKRAVDAEAVAEVPVVAAPEVAEAAPKRTRRKKADVEAAVDAAPEAVAETVAEDAPAKPKRASRAKAKASVTEAAPVAALNGVASEAQDEAAASGEPRRGGWWQRTFGATE
jgi:ribonuclease E